LTSVLWSREVRCGWAVVGLVGGWRGWLVGLEMPQDVSHCSSPELVALTPRNHRIHTQFLLSF
jgi:hypothetical protein